MVAKTCNVMPFYHTISIINSTEVEPYPDLLQNGLVKPKNIVFNPTQFSRIIAHAISNCIIISTHFYT